MKCLFPILFLSLVQFSQPDPDSPSLIVEDEVAPAPSSPPSRRELTAENVIALREGATCIRAEPTEESSKKYPSTKWAPKPKVIGIKYQQPKREEFIDDPPSPYFPPSSQKDLDDALKEDKEN